MGLASFQGNGPEISGVGKDHIGAVCGREAEETGFLTGRGGSTPNQCGKERQG